MKANKIMIDEWKTILEKLSEDYNAQYEVDIKKVCPKCRGCNSTTYKKDCSECDGDGIVSFDIYVINGNDISKNLNTLELFKKSVIDTYDACYDTPISDVGEGKTIKDAFLFSTILLINLFKKCGLEIPKKKVKKSDIDE